MESWPVCTISHGSSGGQRGQMGVRMGSDWEVFVCAEKKKTGVCVFNFISLEINIFLPDILFTIN